MYAGLIPGWEPSFYDNSIGSSNYNALEAKLERRYARGFHALVSYTWSKAIDTGSSGWYSAENGPGAAPPSKPTMT